MSLKYYLTYFSFHLTYLYLILYYLNLSTFERCLKLSRGTHTSPYTSPHLAFPSSVISSHGVTAILPPSFYANWPSPYSPQSSRHHNLICRANSSSSGRPQDVLSSRKLCRQLLYKQRQHRSTDTCYSLLCSRRSTPFAKVLPAACPRLVYVSA